MAQLHSKDVDFPVLSILRQMTATDINRLRHDVINTALMGSSFSPMQGACSDECLELAQLHSDAVDFPKTGRKVDLPQRLVAKCRPDFMESKYR